MASFPALQGTNLYEIDASLADVQLSTVIPAIYGGAAPLLVWNDDASPCSVAIIPADRAVDAANEITIVVPSGSFIPLAVRTVLTETTADHVYAVVGKTSIQ